MFLPHDSDPHFGTVMPTPPVCKEPKKRPQRFCSTPVQPCPHIEGSFILERNAKIIFSLTFVAP